MKWNVVLAFVVLLVAAFAPMNPASTWATGGDTSGAPAVYAGPDQLVDARRATGDAAAEAGFLTQGTKQLKEGTDQLKDGSGELAEAVRSASDGADQLSKGMVEIQAGTGQLADGATRVADSVGGAVDQVVGFEAVRGQILGAIDDTIKATANNRDPQVVDLRKQLKDLRGQVETAELPEDMNTQLTELRDGSRELANQLSTPGYAYHDGIYSATNGASELSKGLSEMNGKVKEATDGVNQLADGGKKVDEMANTNKDNIGAIQRALPAPVPVAGASGTTTGTAAGADGQAAPAPASALAPLAAMLVSALAILGGVVTALAAYAGSRARARWLILGLGTAFSAAAGLILVAILGTNLSASDLAITGLALVLGTLASAGLTWIFRSAFGTIGGGAVAGIFALLQMGVVGWVWSSAATGEVSLLWRAASQALPMHWSTAAISAAGNGGSTTAMWTGIGLSALLAVLGLVAMRASRPAVVSAYDAADAGYDSDYADDDYDDGPDYEESDFDELDDDTAVLDADEAIEHKR